jgi:hypothetical protein
MYFGLYLLPFDGIVLKGSFNGHAPCLSFSRTTIIHLLETLFHHKLSSQIHIIHN